MNNKLKGIFFTVSMIVFFFVGCVEDPETTYYTELINNSDHTIELLLYSTSNSGQPSLRIELEKGAKYNRSTTGHHTGDLYPFQLSYVSATVIYDDTLSVSYNNDDSLAYHNIFLEDSWIREHNDEYSYRYTYEFTNADYEYALEQQK